MRSGTSEAAGAAKAWKNTSPCSWAVPWFLLMSGKPPTPHPPREPQIILPRPIPDPECQASRDTGEHKP